MTDFTTQEYQTRTAKAQKLMAEAGIDALLLCTEAEFRYFSGFRSAFWKSPTRCWYLIVPQNADPIAIIPTIGQGLMKQTWISDIRTFPAPDPEITELPLLQEALANYKNIGLPMGEETTLHMPLLRFLKLQNSIKGKFQDATNIVRELRMVKSKAEINIIKEICSIGSRAFDKAAEIFQCGLPLDQAFRNFRIALLQEGADNVEFLVGAADPLGHESIIGPPVKRTLQKGDILMLDTGATLKGYYCDFDRNFALKSASDEMKKAYETLWKATEAGLKAATPKNRACDVFQAMNNIVKANAGQVGRFGHGLGMQLTEWPSIAPKDKTQLQENMVITLEPSCPVGNKRIMVAEENILITNGKAICLTKRATPNLPII